MRAKVLPLKLPMMHRYELISRFSLNTERMHHRYLRMLKRQLLVKLWK